MKLEFNKKFDDILIQLVFDSAGSSGALDKRDITRVLDDSRREFMKHRKLKATPEADGRILEILQRSLEKRTPGFGDITRLFDTLGMLYEILVDEQKTEPVNVEARG